MDILKMTSIGTDVGQGRKLFLSNKVLTFTHNTFMCKNRDKSCASRYQDGLSTRFDPYNKITSL